MKRWQIGMAILGIGASAVGLSAVATNPGPEAYEEFAAEQLARYLTEKCREVAADTAEREGPAQFLGRILQAQGSCSSLVGSSESFLRGAISEGTERQNYLFLSVYRTELSTPRFIPGASTYQFETIGLYRSFLVRRAEQQ